MSNPKNQAVHIISICDEIQIITKERDIASNLANNLEHATCDELPKIISDSDVQKFVHPLLSIKSLEQIKHIFISELHEHIENINNDIIKTFKNGNKEIEIN